MYSHWLYDSHNTHNSNLDKAQSTTIKMEDFKFQLYNLVTGQIWKVKGSKGDYMGKHTTTTTNKNKYDQDLNQQPVGLRRSAPLESP